MNGVTLRDFEPGDLEAVIALWLEAFGSLKPEDDAARLLETARANAGLFVVAVAGGRVVGTALGTTDTRRGFLYHVAVAREHRRRGIASALVREACGRLFARGAGVVHLRVEGSNDGARRLYRSLGFGEDPPVIGMRLVRPRAEA